MANVLRTLIVEDNTDDALLVMRELETAGYDLSHVRIVDTAESMGEAFQHQKWDIVIADCNMPYFSGAHALEIVRKTDKNIAFIVVSGVITEKIAAEAISAGADDYISKNHLRLLPNAVKRALERAEARKAEMEKEKLSAE